SLPVLPWVLSGKSAEAVTAQAERLLSHIDDHPDLDPLDVAFSLATDRVLFDHRAVVTGRDRDELLDGVSALALGGTVPGAVRGAKGSGKTAFLFTGQGAQRVGMGQELYAAFPVFADAFDQAAAALDPHLKRPLREVITSGDGLDRTEY
ncbi:CurL C-terminal domain-containing protein, partial [Streptomyces apocyni]|uniref:CurL C-terminal domain-containing protein n=1 Tax=Streptomyces apocyni TaxID=2654677 RepID=UPI0012EA1ACA